MNNFYLELIKLLKAFFDSFIIYKNLPVNFKVKLNFKGLWNAKILFIISENIFLRFGHEIFERENFPFFYQIFQKIFEN